MSVPSTAPPPDPVRRRQRWRQIRALLAGGIVFGLGASATVAAWNDAESGTAEFGAGEFLLEANIDGFWNATRQMTFTSPSESMYPGAVTYAPVLLRTTQNTTVAGDMTVTGTGRTDGSGAIADFLEYRAVIQPVTDADPPTCDAGAFTGSATYAFGSDTSWQAMSPGITSPTVRRLEAAQGSTLQYCFVVRLASDAPNSVQGTEAGYTWTWDATSVTPG